MIHIWLGSEADPILSIKMNTILLMCILFVVLIALSSWSKRLIESKEKREFRKMRRRARRVVDIAMRYDEWLQFDGSEEEEFYRKHVIEAITHFEHLKLFLSRDRK